MDGLSYQTMKDIVNDILDSIENNTKNIRHLKCGRCNYEWNFKGKDKYRASCPNCKTSVILNPIRKKKERRW